MKRLWHVATLLVFIGVSSPALPWGAEGHKAVGAIADALLAGHPAAQKGRDVLGFDAGDRTVGGLHSHHSRMIQLADVYLFAATHRHSARAGEMAEKFTAALNQRDIGPQRYKDWPNE